MFSPLTNRTYRRLFSAQVIALAGTGLTTIALSLLAYDLAGGRAGVVLGTALALKMIAYVAIAPIVGGLAHRIPRRPLLVGLDLARAGFAACLPFVTEIWHIYVLIFLLNACSAGFTPTFQATIPDILPDERQYTRALSLSRLAYDLENLLSPAAAALALLTISYDVLFAANALAFLASAALVGSVGLPRPQPSTRGRGAWQNVSFGIAAYLATPRLRGLLALSLAAAAAGAVVIVNTVVYVRDLFGLGESGTAVAFAAAGAGSMAVALLLPAMLDRLSERPVMLAGGGALALGLALSCFVSSLPFLLAVWLLLGAGSSMIQTPAGRILRRSSGEADRPAYYAAQFSLSHGCWLLAYPLAGWLGSAVGLAAASGIMAVFVVAGTVGAAIFWPARDPAVLEHEHEVVRHEHAHVPDEHHRHEHEGWEGPEPHTHPHRHGRMRHSHPFAIDYHHRQWP